MLIKESKINNIEVKPIVNGNASDITKIKGYKLFPTNYWNLFICSRKRSGKTSLINLITDKCVDKKTTFWVFCSTYKIDPNWIEIIKKLEEKGNIVNCFDSITEGKTNLLDEILDGLSNDVEEEEKEPDTITIQTAKPNSKIDFGSSGSSEKKKKEYKPKKLSPKNMFIFDDISSQLKNPAVSRLLKQHRHSNSSVIISSQYLHDIRPESTLQIDYFIAFRSFSQEKLEYIHRVLDLSIEFNAFWDAYKYATEKPYSFLYLNVRTEELRSNFNKVLTFDI